MEEIINCKRCHPGDLKIKVANADGSNQHTIVGEEAWNFAPAWLPNGKDIIFLSDRGNTHGKCLVAICSLMVYVTDATGKETHLVTDISEWLPEYLVQRGDPNLFAPLFWSPDATKLALVAADRSRPYMTSSIRIIDLTKPSGYLISGIRPWILAWSPDSKRIALGDVITAQIMNAETPTYTYVADIDGSSKVKLALDVKPYRFPVNPCTSGVAWHPDGKRIACGGITIMNADGSNPVWIVSGHSPAWVQ